MTKQGFQIWWKSASWATFGSCW